MLPDSLSYTSTVGRIWKPASAFCFYEQHFQNSFYSYTRVQTTALFTCLTSHRVALPWRRYLLPKSPDRNMNSQLALKHVQQSALQALTRCSNNAASFYTLGISCMYSSVVLLCQKAWAPRTWAQISALIPHHSTTCPKVAPFGEKITSYCKV